MTEPRRQGTRTDQRLLFGLNRIELVTVGLASVATWFGFRALLQTTLPYPCGTRINDVVIPCGWTYDESWKALGLPLFINFVIPLMLFLSISAVALVRIIRKDTDQFSTFGLFGLAWPLISFPLVISLWWCFCYGLPLGAIVAGIRALEPDTTKRKSGDWAAVLFNVVWVLFMILYINQWESTYGD